MDDFPAAHSMDSDWFGVDDEGHVGIFDSGEEGPVPIGAGDGYQVMRLVIDGILKLDLEDLTTEADGKEFVYDWPGIFTEQSPDYTYSLLLWLKDDSAFNVAVPDRVRAACELDSSVKTYGDFVEKAPHPRLTLGFSNRSGSRGEIIDILRQAGLLMRAWHDFEPSPERVGLFQFCHWDIYLPGPYLVKGQPKRPFSLSAREEVVGRFGEGRLPGVKFGQSAGVQPMSHVECSTWGERDWVDMNGLVHWHESREDRDILAAKKWRQESDASQHAYRQLLYTLTSAYLDGAEGSADVLNDAFEEHSLPRVATDGGTAHRLAVVLSRVLPWEVTDELADRFVEHLVNIVDQETQSTMLQLLRRRAEIRKTSLELLRPLYREEGQASEMQGFASQLEAMWKRDNSPTSRTVWAAWTLIFGQPHNTAASAQAVRGEELSWQVSQVKQVLSKLDSQ